MKLLVAILLLISVFQNSQAQSEPDTMGTDTNTDKAFRMDNPLYLSMANYQTTPFYPFNSPINTRLNLPPVYSFSHLPSYQISGYIYNSPISGYTDPIGILAEVIINTSFYLIEHKKLGKYHPEFWQRTWSP